MSELEQQAACQFCKTLLKPCFKSFSSIVFDGFDQIERISAQF